MSSDQISQFCAVTGSDEETARGFLSISNYELENAINIFLEGGPPSKISTTSQDLLMRDPIPQTTEMLVDAPYQIRTRRRTAIAGYNRIFEMTDTDFSGKSEEPADQNGRHRRNLSQLFKVPYDIMFTGNFWAAREEGKESKKWLLVNIQKSTEFACQVLNRDIWNDPDVQSLVKEHFIFWQVSIHSDEGNTYNQYYPVAHFPYVAIIDPRTGELLRTWEKLTKVLFWENVSDFISSHMSMDCDGSALSTNPPTSSSSGFTNSEEDEFRQALKASIKEQHFSLVPSACGDMFSDDEINDPEISPISDDEQFTLYNNRKRTKKNLLNCQMKKLKLRSEHRNYQEQSSEDIQTSTLANVPEVLINLALRLPDNSRVILTLTSSTTIQKLLSLVKNHGFNESEHEICTHFPRRVLSQLPPQSTLADAGLCSREVIFFDPL